MISERDVFNLMHTPEIRDRILTGIVGDSISANIEEVYDWFKKNCKGGFRYQSLMLLYSIEFDYDEDITLFTLRWL